MTNGKKLIDFLEQYAKSLYSGVEKAQEKLSIDANSKHYRSLESFKSDIMKRPLILYKMMKDDINDDSDIAALIRLVVPHYFALKEDRDLLLQYFGLTRNRLNQHTKHLERKIKKRLGPDWLVEVYSIDSPKTVDNSS